MSELKTFHRGSNTMNKCVNNIRNTMLIRDPITKDIQISEPDVPRKDWRTCTSYDVHVGHNKHASSSFKQNRRLQMRSGTLNLSIR